MLTATFLLIKLADGARRLPSRTVYSERSVIYPAAISALHSGFLNHTGSNLFRTQRKSDHDTSLSQPPISLYALPDEPLLWRPKLIKDVDPPLRTNTQCSQTLTSLAMTSLAVTSRSLGRLFTPLSINPSTLTKPAEHFVGAIIVNPELGQSVKQVT